MDLVSSLLQAVVSVDGEALVMHTGEKPYVIGPTGQVELAKAGLTLDTLNQILSEVLPADFQQTLEDAGVVQYSLPAHPEFLREEFTVIAARGSDDVWVEIRRRRVTADDQMLDEFYSPPSPSNYPVPSIVEDPPDQESSAPAAYEAASAPQDPASRSADVVPLARNPVQSTVGSAIVAEDTRAVLDRILRVAVARGASTVYLASDEKPSVRVDGELQIIDAEPPLTSNTVASLLRSSMPARHHEAVREGAATEWVIEVEHLGRVRCLSFTDHKGPGAVLRLMARVMTADQLGLCREIRAFADEPAGLVLVAGPRSSGKRTLIAALVDQINRTRRAHVVTIEHEITVAHANITSVISQREVRGGDVRTVAEALREDPDVLALDRIGTPEQLDLALDAATHGHLVIGGIVAYDTIDAIDRMVALYSSAEAPRVQRMFAASFRGAVSQVLLPKIGGGRVAAREVLVGTPAVSSLIAEGKTSQLLNVIEGGRLSGMVTLGDALVSHVQHGLVSVRDAYRYVRDRESFRQLLERRGVDLAPLEQLA